MATLDTMDPTPRTVTIDITAPESIRACIEAEVVRGGYESVGEYLCDLVRQAMEETLQRRLETLLLEGLDSGPGESITPDMWERMRKSLIARRSEQKRRCLAVGAGHSQACGDHRLCENGEGTGRSTPTFTTPAAGFSPPPRDHTSVR